MTVQRDEDLFAAPTPRYAAADLIMGPRSVQVLEGEGHRRLHRGLSHYFSFDRSERYRSEVFHPVISEFVGRLPSQRVEIVGDLLDLLPIHIAARTLGLSWDESAVARARHEIDGVLGWFASHGMDPTEVGRATRASLRLRTAMESDVRRHLRDSKNDLIGALVNVGEEVFENWAASDVIDQCFALLLAGSGTVAELMSVAVFVLANDLDIQETIRSNSDLILPFVDECLRSLCPIHIRLRTARQDTELGDKEVLANQRVYTLNAAANRDPSRFPNPDRFDLRRPSLAAHLAFNVGPRHCPGATLTRLEVSELIASLLNRYEWLSLDKSRASPSYDGWVSRSFRPLHLVMNPRRRLSHPN